METLNTFYIPVSRAYHSRISEVDWDDLDFGKYNTDHMLICDYVDHGWQAPQIVPFGNFSLSPTTLALHYGQTIFEGLKAFRMEDGSINIFRPQKNYDRMLLSAERLCMPMVSRELFLEGLRRLVELEKDWVPGQKDSSLYLRPFIIATETKLRVKVSDSYRFAIVATPTGAYYQQPVRVKVETDFVRAAHGGTGYAKCGGNYGASFYPAQRAREQGYDQVLWTDGRENKYIEESGTMNVFFVLGDQLVTPPLSDSILDGVTRDSLIALANREGIKVAERPVSVEELEHALESKTLHEAFGAGTAAVISPISVIGIRGKDYTLPDEGLKHGIGFRLKEALDKIRYGREADVFS